jgi:hypothetical protein
MRINAFSLFMNYKRKQVLHDSVVSGWNGNKCIFFVYELQKKTSVVPGWNGNKCLFFVYELQKKTSVAWQHSPKLEWE